MYGQDKLDMASWDGHGGGFVVSRSGRVCLFFSFSFWVEPGSWASYGVFQTSLGEGGEGFYMCDLAICRHRS